MGKEGGERTLRTSSICILIILLSSLFLVSVTAQTSPYDPWADLDDDGDIDIFDIVDIAGKYGTSGTAINKTAKLLELEERMFTLEELFLSPLLDGFFDGLVAYYRFDEGNGTVTYDSSGYGHNGTLVGNATWVEGVSGMALWLGGGGTYVQISHSPLLSFSGVHPFTLETWIRPDDLQNQSNLSENVIDKHTNYGLVHDHYVADARGVVFHSGSWHHSGEVIISNGTWHHYVGVYDPPYLIAYLDGQEAARREVGLLSLNDNTNDILFGTGNDFASQYTGCIDEIRIYNRSLSDLEIRFHYIYTSLGS